MKTMIDVGANVGNCSKSYKGIVYAIEPHPQNVKELLEIERDNYHILPFAIDLELGYRELNIHYSLGSCSFHTFSDFDNWKSRLDVRPTGKKIIVPTIPLFWVINALELETIDYLKIDTQGNDLIVLRSLFNHVDKVIEGVVEAAISDESKLYLEQNIKEETIEWLEQNNFIITQIKNNDLENGEVNIHFKKCN